MSLQDTVPELQRAIEDLRRRLYEIERRRVSGSSGAAAANGALIFSWPGELIDGVESPPWYPIVSTGFTAARASVGTAGTGDVLLDVNLDGATQFTLTIPSGDITATATIALNVGIDHYVTVAVNTASTSENASVEFS